MNTGKTLLVMMGLAGLAAGASGLIEARPSASTAPLSAHSPQFGHLDLAADPVFAQGTTPRQMVDAYRKLFSIYGLGLEHMIGGAGLELQPITRWPGITGTPVSLTYSFPPDGIETGGNGANTIHATLTAQFGSEALWMTRINTALTRWSDFTSNIYTLTNDDGANWPNAAGFPNVRGDIRIVSAPFDGQNGVLAFNNFPNIGDMFLDNAENWAQSPQTQNRFFRNVISHENGHGMGLAHSCPANQTKLMEPFITTIFDGPQLDDRLAMQFLYGDPMEPNNSLSTATSLEDNGLVPDTQLTLLEMSLHSAGDGDLYSFEAPAGSTLNLAQVVPTGFTYNSGVQLQNGNCSNGTPFEAQRQFDLILELLGPTGQVLATANTGGLGISEQIDNFTLTSDGPFFIRVRAGAAGPTGSGPNNNLHIQQYLARINVSISSTPGDLNGDGVVNGVDLAVVLASWGAANGSPADLNGDGQVNGIDLASLLASWSG